MNFPENGELSDNRIASDGPTLPLDHSWTNQFEKKLKELAYHDHSQVTCLAEDTVNEPSTSLPSTSSAPSSDPLANMLIDIDGQDVNTMDPYERTRFLTDTYSAVCNLVDHMQWIRLSEIENAECKLCLAYLVLSLNRLAEQPVKTTMCEEHGMLTPWRDVSGTGILQLPTKEGDHAGNWLSVFVASAERIVRDNKIIPVINIGADHPWKVIQGDRSFHHKGSDIKGNYYLNILPALDRIKMTLEDKISSPLGYYKCNQMLIPEKLAVQDLWPAKNCTAKFYCTEDLISHLEKFHDVSGYKAGIDGSYLICSLCGKAQDKVDGFNCLAEHLKKEHNQDVYFCQYDDCSYRSLAVEALKRHMRKCGRRLQSTHVHPCSSSFCTQKFDSFDNYKEHMLKEHKYFYCGCRRLIDSEGRWLDHLKKHYGEHATAKRNKNSGTRTAPKRKKTPG